MSQELKLAAIALDSKADGSPRRCAPRDDEVVHIAQPLLSLPGTQRRGNLFDDEVVHITQ
jgi:hypothetical protein